MKVKIINTTNHPLPAYETLLSAGMDIRAFLNEKVVIEPLKRALIPTGIFIELPENYEAQIRPRSGLAWKHGITVLNSPGTIDADYRGEIKIILVNLSDETFIVEDGMRIAQMIISHHEKAEWQLSDTLSGSDRGEGGYGHTGVN